MSEQKLKKERVEQIDSFIESMHENNLTPERLECFEELLKGERESQIYYLQQMEIIGQLEWQLKSEMTVEAYKRVKRQAEAIPKKTNITYLKVVVAVAALCAVAIALGLIDNRIQKAEDQPAVSLVIEEKLKEPTQVIEKVEEVVANITQSRSAVWEGVEDEIPRFTEGRYSLEKGFAQIVLEDKTLVSIQGPSVFEIKSSGILCQEGIYIVSKEGSPETNLVSLNGLELNKIDGKLGYKSFLDKSVCTQLSGQSVVIVPRSFGGVTLRKTLLRSKGLRWEKGLLIDGIIGDSSPYVELDMTFKKNQELLANVHFEFPRMETDGFVSPSAWKLHLFPSMMAKVNHNNVAGIKVFKERKTSEQWGALFCERQADGTMYGTSFEQKVKNRSSWVDKTLQFHGKFKLDSNIELKEPLRFRLGFYSGTTQSERPLVVKDLEFSPGDHRVKSAEVIYNNFTKPIYQKDLFVRVELFVLADFGIQGLLLDDVSLTVLED